MLLSLAASALIAVSAPTHGNPRPVVIDAAIHQINIQERRVSRLIRKAPQQLASAERSARWFPGYVSQRLAVARSVARQKRENIARLRSLQKRAKRLHALLVKVSPKPAPAVAAPTPTPTPPVQASGNAAAAIAYAFSKLGDPYVWGATGPDTFDCSGLTQAAWAAAGVAIPRDTYEQVAALPAVSRSDLKPGDLLFFDGDAHVAIYIGGGRLIDAPHTGAVVEDVPFAGWFQEAFDSAARP